MKLTNASEVFSVILKVTNAIKQLRQALFALVLFFVLAPLAWSSTYYVATTGNDASSGLTLNAPFKTIQKAMNKAVAGDTVYVRGGVYREDVEAGIGGGSAGKLVKLWAYNSELPVVKGSDVVTGWTLYSGKIWKRTNWAYKSQQVFVGGGDTASLKQVGMPSVYTTYEYPEQLGSGLGNMVPGSFYYNSGNSTLYVWLADGSDPNTKYVEASTRRRLMYLGRPYIHVKGFAFRHSNGAAYTQQSAAVELSSNSIIEQSDIQYTDLAGLSMGYRQTGAQAINCNVSNNGDVGIIAAAGYNFRISNSRMNKNNYRHFNMLWNAGGFKGATQAYGTIENSEVAYNYGSGIWFDYANGGSPIVIRNNYIHDNGPKDSAIFMEVSKNGLIYNNVLVNNTRRGVYISASDNMRVFNNTIVGTKGQAAIELNGMPRSGATLTNNQVRNNIISNSTTGSDISIATANGSSIAGNSSDYNNIYRAGSSVQLYLGKMYYTIASFGTGTGQEKHSISVNSGFMAATNPTAGSSFAVALTSPVINKGVTVAGVGSDYLNVLRPKGGVFDIGAFEN